MYAPGYFHIVTHKYRYTNGLSPIAWKRGFEIGTCIVQGLARVLSEIAQGAKDMCLADLASGGCHSSHDPLFAIKPGSAHWMMRAVPTNNMR